MFIKAKAANACARGLVCGPTKGAFFGDNEYLEMGRKLSQFIDLGRPDPGDFYFGWLASRKAFAQRKRRKAWMARGPIRFGTLARNPEYIH